jgi:hypothetical protein
MSNKGNIQRYKHCASQKTMNESIESGGAGGLRCKKRDQNKRGRKKTKLEGSTKKSDQINHEM